ncbi:hypothetical protein ACFX12_033707 [Malus domestica]
MLLKSIDVFARRILSNKAIIVDGEDVLFLGDHVAEASASRVLERDARRLGTQNPVDVVAVVELVIKAFRDLDFLRRVAVLDDDEVEENVEVSSISEVLKEDVQLIWDNFLSSERFLTRNCML